jgi:hypothetical protein
LHINVVIPAFNVAAYIGDAIRSVVGQSHRDWTLTVVDDGSTDRTGRIARGVRDARIQVIRQDNAGVSAARNRGLDAGDGDAVLFLDADDWLAPNALASLADALRRDAGAVASVGGFVCIDTAGRHHPPVRPIGGDLLGTLLTGNRFVNGGHLLIRRSAIRLTGRFHQQLVFGEDWEYWVRLALIGRFATTPDASPILFARSRRTGACHARAIDPLAYAPCITAIYASPALAGRFDPETRQRFRRRTEAEMAWTIGRTLLRRNETRQAWPWLLRASLGSPQARRIAALAAAGAMLTWPGARRLMPFAVDTDQGPPYPSTP